jgi:hypothetical protein
MKCEQRALVGATIAALANTGSAFVPAAPVASSVSSSFSATWTQTRSTAVAGARRPRSSVSMAAKKVLALLQPLGVLATCELFNMIA